MIDHQSIYPLKGVVQHYAWGGIEFIPNLLGVPNQGGKPFAELWMGMHHSGPAYIQTGAQWILLKELIDQQPEEALGPLTFQRFGPQLPFLFKILDVRQMLSIQAHPSKERAEAGFQRENEAGIPLDAPGRTYKDDNHKPEVMVALTDFWLLHGFLPVDKMNRQLSLVPELAPVHRYFNDHGQDIQSLYQWIMDMPQTEVDELLVPLRERLRGPYQRGKLPKNQAKFWAARAFSQFKPAEGECDRGILSIFLMNLVQVAPGEGIYQGAGILHAYLEGVNVELMANSDNVFRGGLTIKHSNVPELIRNISFEPVMPHIIHGQKQGAGLTLYPTPAPDFELSRLELSSDKPRFTLNAHSPEILIVLEGTITVNQSLKRRRGECFFVPANTHYKLQSEGKAVVFRARTPV